MKKLLLLAIPLLLFGFTSLSSNPKKEEANRKKMLANSLCVASCTTTHIRVKIAGDPLPPGTINWYLDGVLAATGSRIFNVPKTATVVTVTVGSPGVLIAGDNISTLNAQCAAPPCP
jgi:hypothetical protein